jgi:adenosylmethionine-8-amino-7-oxononanoate aminotransferase
MHAAAETKMAAIRDFRRAAEDDAASEAVDLAKSHLVQPWPYAGSIGAEARTLVTSGDGIYLIDGDSKKLIDGPAGMWCVNAGHRRDELAWVMYDQTMQLSYNTPWYTMNEPSAVLAGRLAAHAPGDLSHVFYTTGGSTAVETALRFMQFYNNVRGRPEKKLILSRGGAYHGSTYLSGSLNGRPRDRDWMDGADGLVVKLSTPNPFRRPAGMSVEAFCDFLVGEFRDTVARIGTEKIGAFVAEPVQASGGVIVPPENYLKRISELCRANDILFISDEVVTAFGRLGHVFASGDVFGIEPDMITFAKGVTSGYFPLGGMMVSERLLEDLRRSNHPDAMFAHGLTYSSHPVGCAVVIALALATSRGRGQPSERAVIPPTPEVWKREPSASVPVRGRDRHRRAHAVAMLIAVNLDGLGAVRHGFFTREGGVSQGLYASLNCGLGSGDDAAHVAGLDKRAHETSTLPAWRRAVSSSRRPR